MIKSTFGAPFGGTICGGQYGLESLALRLITPPNFAAGFGTYFPSIVAVPLGEPGVPAVWSDAPLAFVVFESAWANRSCLRSACRRHAVGVTGDGLLIAC